MAIRSFIIFFCFLCGSPPSWGIDWAHPRGCSAKDVVRGELGQQVLTKLFDLEKTRVRILLGFDLLLNLTQKLNSSQSQDPPPGAGLQLILDPHSARDLEVSGQVDVPPPTEERNLRLGFEILRISHQELIDFAEPEIDALLAWMRAGVLPKIKNGDQRKIILSDFREFTVYRRQVLEMKLRAVVEGRALVLARVAELEIEIDGQLFGDLKRSLKAQKTNCVALIECDDRQVDYLESELRKLVGLDELINDLGNPL